MSAFALGRGERLASPRHRSTSPRRTRSRVLARTAAHVRGGIVDGPAAGARRRPHEQRARSRRSDPAQPGTRPAGGAARDFRSARRFQPALLGRSRRIPPARRRQLDARRRSRRPPSSPPGTPCTRGSSAATSTTRAPSSRPLHILLRDGMLALAVALPLAARARARRAAARPRAAAEERRSHAA